MPNPCPQLSPNSVMSHGARRCAGEEAWKHLWELGNLGEIRVCDALAIPNSHAFEFALVQDAVKIFFWQRYQMLTDAVFVPALDAQRRHARRDVVEALQC